jgi:N-acylneuraminate cytidylyltransferase/CMP-N,N'-diacetyllegionaminic acid synthase
MISRKRKPKSGALRVIDPGSTLVVIPARGGSKRLPRKNILPLNGKPLIAWTIETAIQACSGTRILVTSDDDEILSESEQYEAQGVIAHRRSPELATDIATTADAVIDAVHSEKARGYNPEMIVLLQPTSPLRSPEDVVNAIALFHKKAAAGTVVSVCEVDHPTAWIGSIDCNSELNGLDLSTSRSQDHKREYRLNGAVYVASVPHLLAERSVFTEQLFASVMPRKRSLDIDDEMDFRMCECVLQSMNNWFTETGE